MKYCNTCHQDLPKEMFSRDSSSSDGLCYACKNCTAKRDQKLRARYKENNYGKEPNREGTKWCPVCKEYVSRILFANNITAKDGLGGQCRDCFCIRNAIRNSKQRGYNFCPPPNFTGKDIRLLRKTEGNRCYFCGRSEAELGKALVLEHNHETGRIRGLACHTCNTIIIPTLEKMSKLSTEEKHRWEDYLYNPPGKILYEPEVIEQRVLEEILSNPNSYSRLTPSGALQQQFA